MYARGDGEDIMLIGCSNVIDFEVKHLNNHVVLTINEKEETSVPFAVWQQAVFGFADSVEAFYLSSEPKLPFDQTDSEGFRAFWDEWKRRRYDDTTFLAK